MQGVPDEIVQRQIAHFAKADPAYGEGVAKAVACERSAHQPQPAAPSRHAAE
jgi:catalase